MSTPFANPWSNPNNPVDMYRRYKRKKAKRAAAAEAKTDPRRRDLNGNREYSAQRQQNASAYQSHQSRKSWNDPYGGASQNPLSPQFSDLPKPSPHYDPTDW